MKAAAARVASAKLRRFLPPNIMTRVSKMNPDSGAASLMFVRESLLRSLNSLHRHGHYRRVTGGAVI